jgi:hypothetical protein
MLVPLGLITLAGKERKRKKKKEKDRFLYIGIGDKKPRWSWKSLPPPSLTKVTNQTKSR